MSLASSTVPLRRAVIAALTTVTGQPSAIPAASLFREAVPAPAAQRAVTLRQGPTAWVTVRDHSADGDRIMLEMSTVRAERVTVEVLCEYYAGSEQFSSEHSTALVRLEEDRQRVMRALLYPEALRYDPDGDDTGLDGGSLRYDGYRSVGPILGVAGKSRVLSVIHTFPATLELANIQ